MPDRATARDTSIRTYRAKRNFAVTAEPAPGTRDAAGRAPIFVVQKHKAHRAGLHWDFRLEHDGVLWSWAVRKGPSLDPADKRIAAHVEDHPLEYADFQGEIPARGGRWTIPKPGCARANCGSSLTVRGCVAGLRWRG